MPCAWGSSGYFHLEIKDDAQRLALVRVQGALESTLVEPFSKDYGEIISAARRDLLQQ
jgi:hypothetical protein